MTPCGKTNASRGKRKKLGLENGNDEDLKIEVNSILFFMILNYFSLFPGYFHYFFIII